MKQPLLLNYRTEHGRPPKLGVDAERVAGPRVVLVILHDQADPHADQHSGAAIEDLRELLAAYQHNDAADESQRVQHVRMHHEVLELFSVLGPDDGRDL